MGILFNPCRVLIPLESLTTISNTSGNCFLDASASYGVSTATCGIVQSLPKTSRDKSRLTETQLDHPYLGRFETGKICLQDEHEFRGQWFSENYETAPGQQPREKFYRTLIVLLFRGLEIIDNFGFQVERVIQKR